LSCGCKKLKPRIENKTTIIKVLFNSYRRNARNCRREFALTFNQFKELVNSPCIYCGTIDIKRQNRGDRRAGINKEFYTKEEVNGIDRIDNEKGYVEGNVAPCCKACNFMKRDLNKEEWLSQIKHIYEHIFLGEKSNVQDKLGSSL
jgi:hypothetical protein